MKKELLFSMLAVSALSVHAQRQMETLDRGLVAVKTASGVFTSWRIDGTEYYDTQYNLYRDGTRVNQEPLEVSNFTDPAGTESSTYAVRAVVRGEEQEACEPAKVWNRQYLEVPMGKVYSRRGTDITKDYSLNDATAADLDGDGEYELIVKRLYNNEGLFEVDNDSAYAFIEAYKLDGTKLWSIDVGPNMISSGGQVELNIIAYDWDRDGKAELAMRAMDGTIIYDAEGNRQATVGDMTANYRNMIAHSANMTYATAGAEYLLYMEGATAKLYGEPMEFPLKRLESGETDLNAVWGDGYGHRSNKFFFGAPYLDGRTPSLFLARGIYTRHKMIAYDIDPATHRLTERWRWNCSDGGSLWFGQGYHNYGIADVDWDGRDEIVYGSMVIDDNGKGLSATGLGHGDAQHCSDFDPYRKGQEIFACNENAQGANYRDATTSQIYYMHHYGRDCGRAMAGNFTDQYAGSQAVAPGMGLLSTVTDKILDSGSEGIDDNFRIYWDGDLCSETLNGDGTEGPAVVHKFGSWTPIFTASGTKLNNWTKNTPSLQADILGDWREEIIARSDDNMSLRIYTTTVETPWRIYTLLHDMQYRQAVAWQMCGYNQPPHLSYFLGAAEGITVAPPPVMTNGRTEVADAITAAQDGRHVLLADPDGGTVTVADGASPYILTVNAFSHTEGHDNNDNITTSRSEYVLQGGSFGGDMRLVKQGEGVLTFGGTQAYAGPTELWGGVTNFDGTLTDSRVWMNRFAELNASGEFGKDIEMEYGTVLRVGGEGQGTLRADSLVLDFGAVVEFDLYSENLQADVLTLGSRLTLKECGLTGGPAYQVPVFRMVQHPLAGEEHVAYGRYHIMDVPEIKGELSEVVIEGLSGLSAHLKVEGESVYLVVDDMRAPSTVYWNGTSGHNVWDLWNEANFSNEGEADKFATGDDVIFDDAAEQTTVLLAEAVEPSNVVFKNETKAYALSGDGSISGETGLTKQGDGTLTIGTANTYTGKTLLEGGQTNISALANSITPSGAFGAYTTEKGKLEIRNGATLRNTAALTNGAPITIGEGGGTLQTQGNFTMQAAFDGGGVLAKTGAGELAMAAGGNVLDHVVLKEGTLRATADNVNFGDTLVFAGNSTYADHDDWYSYSTNSNSFKVEEGVDAYMYLDGRCTYTGRLYGKGTLRVNVPYVRSYLQGNWSAFEGTLVALNSGQTFSFDNGYGLPKAVLNIPEGVYVGNSGKAFEIGKVTGAGSLGGLCLDYKSGVNTWKIGSLNEDFTFSAVITGAGTMFEKVGTGKMTVNSASDFTGTCTVSAGTLCLNDAAAGKAMMGTGILTVKDGATLCGVGKLGNSSVRVERGGVLYSGVLETVLFGALDFSGKSLSVSDGAVLQFNIGNKMRCNSLKNLSSLTVYGTLKVSVREGLDLEPGDEFTLWNAARTTLSDGVELELDSPGEGLEWDTADLENGILRVKEGMGVESVLADEPVDCEVYTVGGAAAGRFTCVRQDIRRTMEEEGYGPGVYTVKVRHGASVFVLKITVD